MSRRLFADIAVCGILVALGVASRLVKESLGLSMPNFHAVAAVSLFAGYYFSARASLAGKAWALAAPLGAMTISDWALGGYEPLVMIAVYASLLAPAVIGLAIGRRSAWRLVPLAVVATLVFFFATNLAVWWTWYDHDAAGLSYCFARALPFLKYSLAGDLSFAAALFSVYAAATAGHARSADRAADAMARNWS